jgi:hypothetical protein
MAEAAAAVGPHVTGDALLQALVKRRTRYLKEQQEEVEGSGSFAGTVAGAVAGTPRSSAKNTPVCKPGLGNTSF